jgi:hypothetical protein
MHAGSPLIVIGGGRSGSTLVTRLLSAHRAVDVKGETNFLVPRLWLEAWGDRFWLYWPRQVELGIGSSTQTVPLLETAVVDRHRERIARLCADFVVAVLEVGGEATFWGFKEPWNGSRAYRYSWQSYHHIFPGARWLHLIRHPFNFARSCAQWNDVPFTRAYLTERLTDWVSMLFYNRQAAGAADSMFEMRFEDLVAAPRATMAPVLSTLGLKWEPSMDEVLERRSMASTPFRGPTRDALSRQAIRDLIGEISGLGEAMDELRYSQPIELLVDSAESDFRSREEVRTYDLHDPEREISGLFHLTRRELQSAHAGLAEDLAGCRAQVENMQRVRNELERNSLYVLGRTVYRQPVIGPLLASLFRRRG